MFSIKIYRVFENYTPVDHVSTLCYMRMNINQNEIFFVKNHSTLHNLPEYMNLVNDVG